MPLGSAANTRSVEGDTAKTSTEQSSTVKDSTVKSRRALDPVLTRYSRAPIGKVPQSMEGAKTDGGRRVQFDFEHPPKI